MSDPIKPVSNVAENVLNKSSEASRDAAGAGMAAVKDGINAAANVSSTALNAAAEVGNSAFDNSKDVLNTAEQKSAEFVQAGAESGEQMKAKIQAFTERGTQTLNAYAEAGKQATAAFSDVSQAWGEVYSRQLADYNELLQKALRLRSPQDLIEFQSFAAERAQDQLALMRDTYTRAVNAFTRVWQPLTNQNEALAA
jgi:vacuolar-type H+-ATPase subunit H